MTEAEWNGCADPLVMLDFLRGSGKATDRKLRLFAAACCQRTWRGLVDGRSRHVVEVAERRAEGQAAESELGEAIDIAMWLPHDSDAFDAVWTAALRSAPAALNTAVRAALLVGDGTPRSPLAQAAQAALLREIFGPLPFHSLSLDASWLRWNDGRVEKLATAIYERGRFEEMPMLADTLEVAGCSNQEILHHCRQQQGGHVRGCWVLELLLHGDKGAPMTEEQWLAATEPQLMLEWLSAMGRADERRFRLFACACVRQIWHLLADERSRKAVEVAERYADGVASEQERVDAERAARQALAGAAGRTWFAASAAKMAVAQRPPLSSVMNFTPAAERVEPWETEARRIEQTQLFRCIFGNPSRPHPSIDVAVLTWNDRTVVRIAEAIYQEQRWDDVAILADALEEAGYEDAGVIEHLRGRGPHCRGCHVLDAILGKA